MMKILNLTIVLLVILLLSCKPEADQVKMYPVQGVPFSQVKISDCFWLPKIETNRKVTIPASFAMCENYGRMDNFLIAGGKMPGQVKGKMPFDDTDVYKIIEGAAYSLTTLPDPELDAYLDSIIGLIAIGQEADGYLTTYKTIDTTYAPASWCPPGSRWKNLACSHELYNSGHLFEAAAAHYQATGKKNFLDIATRNADLLVEVFGKEKNPEVPGHQIVETGLIKLYLITKKKAYLDLARHFLDNRGDSTKRDLWGPYNQDHKLVTKQEEAVGHAVRAAYMYAGMTDIAALYDDSAYEKAVDKIWDNIVSKKLYLTGGIGSKHQGEAFGENYELPNLTAYNETCAAIANVYWNYRMFLLHGEAKYIDVLERSLYNGVISGVSLDGRNFFYPNPLECNLQFRFNSHGTLDRQPWFDCSCCPSNLCRFLPSVPGYIYALDQNNLYVNLFIESETEVAFNKSSNVTIKQETQYPWDGTIKMMISPKKPTTFALNLRIPGWISGQAVASNLYSYTKALEEDIVIQINGEAIAFSRSKGYAVIDRKWTPGDVVEYKVPMNVRRVNTHQKVAENAGRVALERGPIVYCVEGADNNFPLFDLILPDSSELMANFDPELLGGVVSLSGEGNVKGKAQQIKAIPYYAWNNRGINEMRVWLPK